MEPGLHSQRRQMVVIQPVGKMYMSLEAMGVVFNRYITAPLLALQTLSFHLMEIMSFCRMMSRRAVTSLLSISPPCNSTCFRSRTYLWIGGGWRHRGGDKPLLEAQSQRSCLWLF